MAMNSLSGRVADVAARLAARSPAPAVLAVLTTAVEQYDPTADEGRYAIEGVDLDGLQP